MASWSVGTPPNPQHDYPNDPTPLPTIDLPTQPTPYPGKEVSSLLPPPPSRYKPNMAGIGQGFLTPFDDDTSQRTRELGTALERYSNMFGTNLAPGGANGGNYWNMALEDRSGATFSDGAAAPLLEAFKRSGLAPQLGPVAPPMPIPFSAQKGRAYALSGSTPPSPASATNFFGLGLKNNGRMFRSFGELANYLVRGGYLTADTLRSGQDFLRQVGGWY